MSRSTHLHGVTEAEGETEDGFHHFIRFQEHEVADDPGQAEHHGHGHAAEHFTP